MNAKWCEQLRRLTAIIFCVAMLSVAAESGSLGEGQEMLLPTGKRITPLAAPGAKLELLNPGLEQFPGYIAGEGVSTAMSPDKSTLLVLTSGYNRMNGADGKRIAAASNEYVFIYDVSSGEPRKRQVLQVPNTFMGITFSPDGSRFFVSGGKDDNCHTFSLDGKHAWEDGEPIPLGHTSGLGLVPGKEPLAAGGIAVTLDGNTLLVANVYNDSISFVGLKERRVIHEVDLRPGKINSRDAGVPGGEYPFWIAVKDDKTAYVSSLRDREIVELGLSDHPAVLARMKVAGNPNKMILNRLGSRLYVACDNSDTIAVIDTRSNQMVESIRTIAPTGLLGAGKNFTGSAPNDLALSPDEKSLYVTNGGSNSVAVIQLAQRGRSQVTGLIPTGWFPTSLSLSADGKMLYVVNGKSVPGPNPNLHNRIEAKAGEGMRPGPAVTVNSRNEYIFQLEKAGLLSLPVPDGSTLDRLTRVVAENNGFAVTENVADRRVMNQLRRRIKHVIYIIKENRTYDQVLGDLGRGNGDRSLAEFGEAITPNFHSIARRFVDLDNFYNSGEVSGDGWPWSTAGRESDYGQKAVPLNYGDRGTSYEYEGPNRDINVGLATLEERKKANPKTPDDPDLLPGASNVAAPDGPDGTPKEKGYIWDAVLRAGLTFREYGCMSDTLLDAPREPFPFRAHVVMSRPANPELYKFGDPYFRGFDPGYPDFYREAEWEREFDQYAAEGNLPAFEIVQLQEDHMGEFATAISKVNTPERQQADNDYAVGRLIDRVAHSRYKSDTLLFILEDDSQDGPDHVDAHRSTAYVAGPYVKQGAVVSKYYTTVSMLRTMEDILGLDHLNLNTATTRPMTDVFDLNQKTWNYEAKPSWALADTELPLGEAARKAALAGLAVILSHDSHYWAERTKGFDFTAEDRVNADEFNRIVWEGMMGTPYPVKRAGAQGR